MMEPQLKTIDGLAITVQAWPARKAWRFQSMYGKLFKSSLKDFGAAIDEVKGTKGDIDLSLLGSALASLFDTLSEQAAEDILTKTITGIFVDKVEITMEMFDTIFQGKMLTVYKVVGFVLEVNYGSFLGEGGIGGLLKK